MDQIRLWPLVVLGGVGRGQDKQALMEFVSTIGQTMGPEALMKFIDPTEFLKRLAAASGIDTLNLVKSAETMAQEGQQAQEQAMQASLMSQAGQLAKSPAGEALTQQMIDGGNSQQQEAPASPPKGPEA